MTYNIYSKDGNTIRCFTDKVEYNGVFMGDVYINITVKSEIHIDFEIGDYIMYRGEKFTLQNIPTEKKVSDKKVNGEVFQYDNIKFTGEAPFCFSNADFNDFVGDSQTDVSFTAQPNFSFIAATPADLAQRIQVNMDRYYTGADKWTIQMADGYVVDEDHENLLITVSNISCWDALALFKSKYDINFITRGRVCTIGTSGSIKDITFKVGSFKGLYDMTRNVQSDQSIITRLTSYGNTTNINPRYYSLVSATVIDNITHAYLYSDTRSGIVRLVLQFNLSHTTELRDNITVTVFNYTIKMVFGSFGDMAGYGISLLESDYSNISNTIYNSLSVDSNNVPQANKSVIINSGARKDNITDLSHISFDVDSKLPNNMAVTNLMLPGFPTQTLAEWAESNKYKYSWLLEYINQGYTFSEEKFYPYVNSKNISSLGIRPKTEYFTTDDETHKDIYPSLQYFSDDRNKVVSVFNEDGTSISDNGLYQDGATVPQIKINIKDLGFYFDDVVISGTEPKLHFNNGYCGGRDFTIKSWSLDNTFLYCDRIKDDTTGKYYPNVDSPILEGDIFVLSDIYMPDTYIEQASIELLRWNLKLLVKNDFTVFSYSLSPDSNFIKRHDDAIEDKSTTFHKTIKEGDFLLINDSDMNINGAITIDSLKITEGDGILPKYTITLKETKTVGTIQKVMQQIDALSGNGDTSGYNSSQIGQISYSYLKNRFLSREYNDSTPYSIGVGNDLTVGGDSSISGSSTVGGDSSVGGSETVVGDSTIGGNLQVEGTTNIGGEIVSKEYAPATQEGWGIVKKSDGHYMLSITDMEVWGKAVFNSLEIRKLVSVSGNYIFSPANGTILYVQEFTDYYRCYMLADDGGKAITNDFAVNDLVLCETFNIAAGVYQNVSNKRYWRKTVAVSTTSELLYYQGILYYGATTPENIVYDESGNPVMFKSSEPYFTDKKFFWIDLSKTDCELDSDIPSSGDAIATMGNWSDTDRQNFIEIISNGTTAPSINMYTGVNRYTLADKMPVQISPSKVEILADLFNLRTINGTFVDIPNFKGVWTQGTVAYENEQYSYDGRMWLCINTSTQGTTTAPTLGLDWNIIIDKGEKGDTGDTGSDGIAGQDGRGLTSTVITYQLGLSGTVAPNGTWTSSVPTLVQGQYLWTKTVWTYTDNSTETGYSVTYIAQDGNDGTNGIAGKDGVGIKLTTITYQIGDSGTVTPSGTWTSSVPTAIAGKYLWTKIVWTYTDDTTETGYSISKYGEKGDTGETGADGIAGKDGVGISSTVITYQIGTSGTVTPTGTWTSGVPTLVKGQYLWTKTVWNYTDSTTETGYSVAYVANDGNNGTDGIAGKDGVGISSTTITYQIGDSGTTAPTGTWSASIPTSIPGKYLWTRTVWTYTDSTNETGYSVSKYGEKGDTGNDGIAGKDGVGISSTTITYQLGISGTVAPTGTWNGSVPTLVKGQYLWTKTVWTYTDSTSETGYSVSYVSMDGNNGSDGLAGKDGVGISDTTITYQIGDSGTTAPTGTWSSTVPTSIPGKYLWTRTIWTYTDSTNETGYSVSRYGEKGDTGNTGASVYLLDLTNESSSVTCDKNGTVVGTLQGTTATLYYGQSVVSGVTYSAVFNGCSGSINQSTGAVTMSGLTSDTGTVTIMATHSSGYLIAIYSISKVYAGADGSNAVTYYIIPSVSAIQKDNDTLTPSTITCSKYKQIGGQTPVITTEKTLKYKQSSDTSETTYSSSITISSYATYIDFILYDADGTTILDKERIPVIQNGISVNTVDVEYASSTSNSVAPTSGWKTTAPAWQNGYYIWTRTIVQMSDGTETSTDPVCITGGKGISSITEYYYKSSSATSLTGGSWSTTVPTWQSGYYIWTKSVITYTDSTTEETYPVNATGAAGANGTNGTNGTSPWVVVLNPTFIIFTQALDKTIDYNNTSNHINISMYYGDTLQTIDNVSKLTEEHCTASILQDAYNNYYLKITAISQDTSNNYYNEGYVEIVVTKGGTSRTAKFPWALNALGTFEETIINDTDTRYASKTEFNALSGSAVTKTEMSSEIVQSANKICLSVSESNMSTIFNCGYSIINVTDVTGGSAYQYQNGIFTQEQGNATDHFVVLAANVSGLTVGLKYKMHFLVNYHAGDGPISSFAGSSASGENKAIGDLSTGDEIGSYNKVGDYFDVSCYFMANASSMVCGFRIVLNDYDVFLDFSIIGITIGVDINTDLLATGIDIENKEITVTANSFNIEDNNGNVNTVFETVGGVPMLKTNYIQADTITARRLKTNSTGANTEIVSDMMSQYNDLGELRTLVHGGTLGGVSSTVDPLFSVAIGVINRTISASNGLIQTFDIKLSTSSFQILSLANIIKLLDNYDNNNVPITCDITCSKVTGIGTELYISGVSGENCNDSFIWADNPTTGTLNITEGMSGTVVLSSKVAQTGCDLYLRLKVTFEDSTGSLYIYNTNKNLNNQSDALRGTAIYGGDRTEMAGDGFMSIFGNYGIRINSTGIQKTTNGGTTWVSI